MINQCDQGHGMDYTVKLLPLGGSGNAILCFRCFHKEMKFREERNKTLVFESNKFDLPKWGDLKVYDPS